MALLADFALGFLTLAVSASPAGCSPGLFSGSGAGVGSGVIRAMAASALFSLFAAGVDAAHVSAAVACFSRFSVLRVVERERFRAVGAGAVACCSGGGCSAGAKVTIGCRMSLL